MKEVSCIVLDALFNALEEKHLAPEVIFSGIPYDLSYLRNKHERIDWETFCRVMSNASAIWSMEDFEKIGYGIIRTRLWRFAAPIAALLFTTTEFYTWHNSPGKSGGGRQILNCVLPTQKIIAQNHIKLILEIEQGYQDCPEFFYVAKGGMATPPVAFGLDPATVEMEKIERGAVYNIHYSEARGALVWLRKIITWPFAARIVARELKEANEALHERYAQLEQTNIEVQRQADQLKQEYRNKELMQQEFLRKQIESQEAERKHLAAELHDGLGQDLLIVNNELQDFLNSGDGSRDDLRRVSTLVQESIEGVREISSDLHPHHIERLGFCAAVDALADKLSHSSPVAIQCKCEQIEAILPKGSEIHLYRIIQESLSNIVKHSGATSARVEIRKKTDSVEITVSDNGRGFDVAELSSIASVHLGRAEIARGFGLASMSERARIIGGTLRIESSTSSGTTIRVMFPVSQRSVVENANDCCGDQDVIER
jgi:signal transduction histidine kinase